MESFALELEPDSKVYPIMIQAAGTVYGAATINRAIRTAEELGYTVVGGINSDFFTLGSGVPNGISIEGGIYKSSPEGGARHLRGGRRAVPVRLPPGGNHRDQ